MSDPQTYTYRRSDGSQRKRPEEKPPFWFRVLRTFFFCAVITLLLLLSLEMDSSERGFGALDAFVNLILRASLLTGSCFMLAVIAETLAPAFQLYNSPFTLAKSAVWIAILCVWLALFVAIGLRLEL